MSRLLLLLMAVMLVLTHGASVAAAICRHQDGSAHVAALASEDSRIAAVAQGEENAGKAASRKGISGDSGSPTWASDMLPAPALPIPYIVDDPDEPGRIVQPVLVGASVRPLLEPPSA